MVGASHLPKRGSKETLAWARRDFRWEPGSSLAMEPMREALTPREERFRATLAEPPGT